MKRLEDFPDAHLRIFDRPPPPDPDALREVYLIGICGTGMGSLAGLFQEAGCRVRGADRAAYPPMSTRLAALGVDVHEGYDAAHLARPPDLVVVGNACTPTHVEATAARQRRLPQVSFPEALAHYFIRDRRSLVVTGTHGKTTTTSLLVHVLRTAGLDPGFLVGGVMGHDARSYAVGTGPHFVVEGDEYDSAYFDKRPKFMHYRPVSAVVTSMEFDHADIYDDEADYRSAFEAFVATVPAHGLLTLCGDEAPVRALAAHTRARVRTYGLEPGLDLTARDVDTGPEGQAFTLIFDGTPKARLFLPMHGRHNLLNALAVCAVALDEGLTPDQLAAGLASFAGVRRRQEVRGEAGGVVVVDDFAHHPTAVRETLRAARQRWPHRRLIAVFEPRSNSSRRKVFEAGYAAAFDLAAEVFFSAPPFRHNDRREDFMDLHAVIDVLVSRGIPAHLHPDADALLPDLRTALRPGDVALIMSNGSFGGLHEKLLAALSEPAPTH